MEFSPFNPVIKLCIQGMEKEQKGDQQEAAALFYRAWEEAANDFERFLAAHYLSRQQQTPIEKLGWLSTALDLAKNVNDDATNSALPSLYQRLADCYAELGEPVREKEFRELSVSSQYNPSDKGPFYHGTKADLRVGDLLTSGITSNYQAELTMNHIYFTALPNGAGLAAALSKGDGRERVYIVEPAGTFENDPNLTDKKFPGNPSRSYRSAAPLKIVGELTEWVRASPENIHRFREKLANSTGQIIN